MMDENSLIQAACDIDHVNTLLSHGSSLDPAIRGFQIESAEIIRHKVGKRCLLKYCGTNACGSKLQFLGKIRFKGLDIRSAEIQDHLYRATRDASNDFSVPQVYGVLPTLNMWLQEFIVHGTALSVNSLNCVMHQCRVANALARLHQTHVPNLRQYTINDESVLLNSHFRQLRQTHPQLHSLIDDLEETTADVFRELLGGDLETTIHRDFYFDQLLICESQIVLIDLDLCSFGPPELDVGNYVGHLREYALRVPDMASICQAAEQEFRSEYFRQRPWTCSKAVELWATLTLARHVFLSTILGGRSHTTQKLAEKVIAYDR